MDHREHQLQYFRCNFGGNYKILFIDHRCHQMTAGIHRIFMKHPTWEHSIETDPLSNAVPIQI